jgi:hypothetical protein
VDDVDLFSANVDPTDEEENPSQTEEGDECGVESDKETQC